MPSSNYDQAAHTRAHTFSSSSFHALNCRLLKAIMRTYLTRERVNGRPTGPIRRRAISAN